MSKESLKRRIDRRIQQIAKEEGLTNYEVEKIFKSQFKFAKDTIEGLDEEFLMSGDEDELDTYVFNFSYIGKIVTDLKRREWARATKEEDKLKYNKDE